MARRRNFGNVLRRHAANELRTDLAGDDLWRDADVRCFPLLVGAAGRQGEESNEVGTVGAAEHRRRR
jgi:hypothetical protein